MRKFRKNNKEIYVQQQGNEYIVSHYDCGILFYTELYGYNTIQFLYLYFEEEGFIEF